MPIELQTIQWSSLSADAQQRLLRRPVFDQPGLVKGSRVLVHGAAGAVGHLAIQLARAFSGRGLDAAHAWCGIVGRHDVLHAGWLQPTRARTLQRTRGDPGQASLAKAAARAQDSGTHPSPYGVNAVVSISFVIRAGKPAGLASQLGLRRDMTERRPLGTLDD